MQSVNEMCGKEKFSYWEKNERKYQIRNTHGDPQKMKMENLI